MATLVSGGATGADAAFTVHALEAGHGVTIKSFAGHKVAAAAGCVVEQPAIARMQDQYGKLLEDTARTFAARRSTGAPGSFTRGLLLRNMAIALTVDRVYAVVKKRIGPVRAASSAQEEASQANFDLGIDGGTAWACQVFAENKWLQMHTSHMLASHVAQEVKMLLLDLFVFDGILERWFCLTSPSNKYNPKWLDMGSVTPPSPSLLSPSSRKTYAGIGSRELTAVMKAAIARLFAQPSLV